MDTVVVFVHWLNTNALQSMSMLGSVSTHFETDGSEADVPTQTNDGAGPDSVFSVKFVYNTVVRPHLPYKLSAHNGVITRQSRLLDRQDSFPDYEEPILSALRQHVRPGDDVVVVGGGVGASSVTAAKQAGSDGSVVTHEAGETQTDVVAETLELNGVADRVDLRHAIVGSAISLYSAAGDANIVAPEDLPECDVLELDCEGAEIEILENLEVDPRVLVVETHGKFDAPESLVREKLDELGYDIVERVEDIPEQGVYVLTAVRSDT
jgi:hypothetical protein